MKQFEYIIQVQNLKISSEFWNKFKGYLKSREITFDNSKTVTIGSYFFILRKFDSCDSIIYAKTNYNYSIGEHDTSFFSELTAFFVDVLAIKYYDIEIFVLTDYLKLKESKEKRILTKKSMSLYLESNPITSPVSSKLTEVKNKRIEEYKILKVNADSIEQAWFSFANKIDYDGWDMVSSNFMNISFSEVNKLINYDKLCFDSSQRIILYDNFQDFDGKKYLEIIVADKHLYKFYKIIEKPDFNEDSTSDSPDPRYYYPLNLFRELKYLTDWHQYETYSTQINFKGDIFELEITIDLSFEKEKKFELVKIKLYAKTNSKFKEKKTKRMIENHPSLRDLKLNEAFIQFFDTKENILTVKKKRM